MEEVAVNSIVATPNRLHKFKRKQADDDEYTPRSRHIDKKVPLAGVIATPVRHSTLRQSIEDKENLSTPRAGNRTVSDCAETTKDVFEVEDTQTGNRQVSVGSIMSQPDFSASVLQSAQSPRRSSLKTLPESLTEHVSTDDSDPDDVLSSPKHVSRHPSPTKQTPRQSSTRKSVSPSPARTPRVGDFRMPLTTPRSIVDAALRAHQHASGTAIGSVSGTPRAQSPSKFPLITEADLISFQTPAPRNRHTTDDSDGDGAGQSLNVKRFIRGDGEEMLLDMTPRVYSPKSIPIYTLRDLDAIKQDFARIQQEQELKIASLHEELATSVSHANHHRALAAQGESLHAEYSKKHVRKVTALKTDWERKTLERVAIKEAKIEQLETLVQELKKVLAQEREEKKEVIAMAEAVLALQQAE